MMDISFDRLAEAYDATRGLPPKGAFEQISDCVLHLTRATPDTNFLEPGVGTGRIAISLVQRGYSYTGVDISERMLEEFGRKLAGAPNRLTLVRADATSLPFEDASFDVALTSGLLYYIDDWRLALREIRRVLKPHGLYLYCYEEMERNTAAEDLDRQWKAILMSIGFEPVTGGNFTDDQALKLLQEQGAKLEKVIAADWRYEMAVGEYLETYSAKVRPLYQWIPDELFSAAILDFKAWAGTRFKAEEMTISSHIKFVIQVIRHWTAL
jgi:ubiquinone/menaquinone biosynthesis C-methylase UbiE